MTAVAERPAPAMTERASRQVCAADHMTFAALLTAVGCARLFVKYTLQNWNIGREQTETAELLTSELVTNAVKTTGITEPQPSYTLLDQIALIQVRLLLFADSVVIEVWDSDPKPPVMKEQTHDAEGGRGLFPVESMSRRWNYYHPRTSGKVVWCEIGTPQWPAEDDTTEFPRVLPRRKPYTGPTRPTQVMNDPELLRRVIEGLHALDNNDEPKGD